MVQPTTATITTNPKIAGQSNSAASSRDLVLSVSLCVLLLNFEGAQGLVREAGLF